MSRECLTREQIVRTAIELLDAEGVEGLSMRQLGSRLGTAATAVYWHVKSKNDLIGLAADAVWGEIELPDRGAVEWRIGATITANETYAMAMRHPWLVSVMCTHLACGPGKARHDDRCLALYQAAGFSEWGAEQAVNVVLTFVLGMALGAAAEVAWRGQLRRAGGDSSTNEIATPLPWLRPRSEGRRGGAVATPGEGLEFGIQTILDGLEARLGARP
jgi:AcrR family transcriptional regulator